MRHLALCDVLELGAAKSSMILSMALFLPSLVSILVKTSLLIAFWTCLMTGKSALLLVAAVCGSPGASPDVVLELAADEELAGGNPRASAIIVCCGVARTWPTRDEDDDEMEDLRVEILDVPVAAPSLALQLSCDLGRTKGRERRPSTLL